VKSFRHVEDQTHAITDLCKLVGKRDGLDHPFPEWFKAKLEGKWHSTRDQYRISSIWNALHAQRATGQAKAEDWKQQRGRTREKYESLGFEAEESPSRRCRQEVSHPGWAIEWRTRVIIAEKRLIATRKAIIAREEKSIAKRVAVSAKAKTSNTKRVNLSLQSKHLTAIRDKLAHRKKG
jgi:hypothetical protein